MDFSQAFILTNFFLIRVSLDKIAHGEIRITLYIEIATTNGVPKKSKRFFRPRIFPVHFNRLCHGKETVRPSRTK